MKVREIMTTEVKYTHPEMSVRDAASVMADMEIGGLPVVQEGKIVGFVTDRDIVLRAVAQGRDLNRTTVAAIMSSGAHKLLDDQDVQDAVRIMREQAVRRMIVTNRDGKIVGLLTLGDLARHPSTEADAAKLLKEISAAQPTEWSKPGVGV